MRQMAGWESVHLPDFHFLMAALFVCFRPWVAKPYKMNYVTTLPRIYVDAEQRVWSKEQGQLLVFDLKREAFEPHVDQVLANWGIQEPYS